MTTKISISTGNSKLGKISNVSLTPVESCGNAELCKDDCYALGPYKQYPNVKKSWDRNLKMAREHPDQYFQAIQDHLNPIKYFRFHVSGEILNDGYFKRMCRVAYHNPQVNFMVLTKMYSIINSYPGFPAFIPDNLSVILSVWPGLEFENPYDLPLAFMQDGTETRVVNAIECSGKCDECHKCWSLKELGKNVVFNKH
jgi:hypothetical protein